MLAMMQRYPSAATTRAERLNIRLAQVSARFRAGSRARHNGNDIHALEQLLGLKRVAIVVHDIGLMVAYAYTAQYPAEVDRIVLMDVSSAEGGRVDESLGAMESARSPSR
jgi:pimeloyl-ACP methyl ester carboxylesterase